MVIHGPFAVNAHDREVLELVNKANGSIVIVISYGEGYSEEAKRSKKGFYVDIQHKLSSDLGQDFIDNKWKEFHGVMFQNPDNALRFRNKIVDMLSIERLSGGIPD
jgi:hypothetical protein